jgi:hypothetical protein
VRLVRRNAFGLWFLIIGVDKMEIIPQVLNAIAWPIVVLIIALCFRKIIKDIFSRVQKVVANSKGIELILDQLEKERKLPFGAREELSGLTSHDIWALDEFARNKITTIISDMNLAQKVAARSLMDVNLLVINNIESKQQVEITQLGRQILAIANTLL